MTLATARPATATATTFRLGQVVMHGDLWHTDRTGRRPHMVVGIRGTEVHLVALSHTPQGALRIDGLGGETYVAGIDFRNGQWTGRFVAGSGVDSYATQLGNTERTAALAEATRQYGTRRPRTAVRVIG